MKRRSTAAAAALLAAVLALAAAAGAATAKPKPRKAKPPKPVSVQILGINDFHGNLEPPSGSSARITTPTGNVDAGGVEYLATHVKQLKMQSRYNVVVSAGDLIGASPLLSALFHDEPTIEAMNSLGLQLNAVGNHEFDEGLAELLRMQRGGCHPTDGCLDGDPYNGARFRFLAANVVYASGANRGKTIFPAYRILKFGAAKIAFVGVVLEGTPTIVTPSGVAGLRFLDEAQTVNRLVPTLRKAKVSTIVVLIHEGGIPTGGYDECPGISGPIVDIANRMSNAVSVVMSGHTHAAYNCVIDNKLVTSGSSFGRLVTQVKLTVDPRRRRVAARAAHNVIVTRAVAKDSAQTALMGKYSRVAAPIANRVIGAISSDITRAANAAGESALGDVIADAQLEATRSPAKGGAVVAFMNPGGIRAELTSNQQSGGEAPGQVTYAEAFTVQPFSNTLVVKTMTGDQIRRLLEQQFDNPAPGQDRILQVSSGFTYSYNRSAPAGSRVVAGSMRINDVPVDMAASYRVTMNSFLADGGDNFTVFREGTNQLGGEVDIDALVAYFAAHSPVAPGPRNRITRVG